MHAPTPVSAATHAGAVKATSTTTEAASAAAARIRIVRDQSCGEQNKRC
ncbi:hypothetical protein JQ581_25780 [Bradyrhizobium liaoningense]|nr:hypothetical protein [Bradyrhizobium liaoningense]